LETQRVLLSLSEAIAKRLLQGFLFILCNSIPYWSQALSSPFQGPEIEVAQIKSPATSAGLQDPGSGVVSR
jgi:hypothetical protein